MAGGGRTTTHLGGRRRGAPRITTHHSPDNATGIEMQWMDDNGATSQNLAEQDTVPSGEGVFDVRALLHTTTEFYASNWQEVVVECDTDLPLRGTPDFTG